VDRAIGSVIAPQWDPATGRLEAVIPISAMASGYASMGNWADILVVLVSYDAARNVWHDGDRMLLHYRLSVPGQSWIYGNIEQ
jgi:hypothetical protein